MLILVLGTVASGSTWAFNVVRGLLAGTRPDAVSLYAERAGMLLANIPDGGRDVVVKAHSLDAGLVNLAAMAGARVILTCRDPRDSVVSMRERFGHDLQGTVASLSRSHATLSGLATATAALVLRFEDGFTDDRATVDRLARHLGLPCRQAEGDAVFAANGPEQVRSRVAAWAAGAGLDPAAEADPGGVWDAATHWHPRHVGDRRSGKWRDRLSEAEAEAVAAALPADLADPDWMRHPVRWSSLLFAGRDATPGEGDDALALGPPMHLPAGRWRVTPILQPAADGGGASVTLDLLAGGAGRLAQRHGFALPCPDPERAALVFDHLDPDEALTIRLGAAGPGARGLRFEGVALRWLEPADPAPFRLARPVGAGPQGG